MKLHRFFVPHIEDVFTVTDADQIHQWKRVFRMKTGDKALFFDGSGFEFLGEFTDLDKEFAEVKILEKTLKPELKKLTLAISIPKKDNFELIIEKATELGVTTIIPLISERTEKKNVNMDRARKIALEASEQSGRVTVPEIHEPVVLQNFNLAAVVLDPRGERREITEDVLMIGPEGGWSEKEIEYFKSKNLPIVSIGEQVLRVETAAIAILGKQTLCRW
jgi:16S rRNA (uracil1498-N3)-methyltransferase